MRADLHVHSRASDGSLTPTELVRLALAAGLTHLAITDHDSVQGIPEALEAAAGSGLELIPGVELSSVSADGRDVHILGYFVRHTDEGFLEHLSDLRTARLRRAEAMVRSLSAGGLALSLDQVLEVSDGGAIGRSHVARALVHAGHARSVSDAFERFIGRGGPHYIAKDVRSPAQAVECITQAGGLSVVAHPGVNDLAPLIRELAPLGLSGVEAYHADHSLAQRARFEALASDLGLLTTGGSDFHAPDARNPELGSVHVPAESVVALLTAGAAL